MSVDCVPTIGNCSIRHQIKHRKAEIAHERGGLMASLGQTIAGPRFYETDEVRLSLLH